MSPANEPSASDLQGRPRLAPKARLRRDRLTGAMVLLWPERGLVLNRTAAELLALCTGALEVDALVAALAKRFDQADPANVRVDVLAFLRALDERRLLRWER